MILGVAVGAKRRRAVLTDPVGFEVRAGGVEEQQVDLEVKKRPAQAKTTASCSVLSVSASTSRSIAR
jgi:hypothetical protein